MPRVTLQTVLDSVNQLKGSVGSLEGKIDILGNKVGSLEGRFDGLEGRFDGLEGRFNGLDDRMDTLAIQVFHLDEKVGRCATKDELYTVKSDLLASMDRIASKYDRVDIEITAGVHRDDELDHRVTTLEQKYV